VEGATIVFVGGTCGSIHGTQWVYSGRLIVVCARTKLNKTIIVILIHIEYFNKNMKALGGLESKWDLGRKTLARRLIEKQDKVLRSYFAQKGGTRSKGGDMETPQYREHIHFDIHS